MISELLTSLTQIVSQTKNNLYVLGIILLIPWTMFIVTRVFRNLLLLGIIPRRIIGLRGIVFAPVLHVNFNHIFFNSIPLVVLSNFILINGLNYYLTVTFMITLLSGLSIWLFAKPGLHVGASAIITGYWGFLVYNIYQHGTVTTIILGVLSLYYFAGLFLGIFPGEKGVSWQGHLFGLLSGLATCYLLETYPQLVFHFI
ncbi:rhomboid family intramembrane serine protease [Legionella waltersii]|uniref:Putative rhomboid family protein n=1 Tax=Legionella waltersii TaxID=66969 RepID=A0A0W1AN83_9GAMM|nr:rhomboid family intramembrane serine protease [Legionella waltersii]KTD82811.1 putative rhomboid family protein [Legionella waltersii]SNV01498.1 putative rhomboid family protein [Legionella waltersii]